MEEQEPTHRRMVPPGVMAEIDGVGTSVN
jgi:hypothetical protein